MDQSLEVVRQTKMQIQCRNDTNEIEHNQKSQMNTQAQQTKKQTEDQPQVQSVQNQTQSQDSQIGTSSKNSSNRCRLITVILISVISTFFVSSSFYMTLYYTVLNKYSKDTKTIPIESNLTSVMAGQTITPQTSGNYNIIVTCQNNGLQSPINTPNQSSSTNASQESTASQGKWIYFDEPKHIDTFLYNTEKETNINFASVIPETIKAKEMKLILFLRTGSENNAQFWTRTRVINGDQEVPHWTFGHRYPQLAISYNSETVTFPISKTREFRVKSNHIQPTNCHTMQYFIVGYKI